MLHRIFGACVLLLTGCFDAYCQKATLDSPPDNASATPKTRLLPYPLASNVALGQGWNSLKGRPSLATCIEFKETSPQYQDTRLSLDRATDDESLTIKAGLSMGVNASVDLGDLLSANAETSFTLNGYYKTTASSDVFVASVDIVNGGKTVGPTRSKVSPGVDAEGVLISDGLRTLLGKKGVDEFHRICGDAFVAGILSGGSLQFFYRFKTKSYDERVSFTQTMKGSGSFLGIFGGGASSTFTTEIEKLINAKKLTVNFIQSGGKGGAIPYDIDTLKSLLTTFSQNVADNAKPTFILLRSYTELPNWTVVENPDVNLSVQQRYQRLANRLAYLQRTADEIIQDSQRDLSKEPDSTYLRYAQQKLRSEAVAEVQDRILDEIKKIPAKIRTSQEQKCSVRRLNTDPCKVPESEFDDYPYRILLPLPRNAVPADVLTYLADDKNPREARVRLLAKFLYIFWVDQPARERCQLLGECQPNSYLRRYLDMVQESLAEGLNAQDQLVLLNKYQRLRGATMPTNLASDPSGDKQGEGKKPEEKQAEAKSKETPEATEGRRLYDKYELDTY